ncbi:hypothetical protein ACLOJK_014411 [Asimina triloba]
MNEDKLNQIWENEKKSLRCWEDAIGFFVESSRQFLRNFLVFARKLPSKCVVTRRKEGKGSSVTSVKEGHGSLALKIEMAPLQSVNRARPLSLFCHFAPSSSNMRPQQQQQQCNQAAAEAAPTPESRSASIPFVTAICIVFLTVNTVVAVIRAHRDLAAVLFIIALYVSVILLYWCLYVYQRLPEGSPKREKLKIPIWSILMGIQFLFVYKLGPLMGLAWRVFAWILVASTALLGFYFLFVFRHTAADHHVNNKPTSNKVSPVEDV